MSTWFRNIQGQLTELATEVLTEATEEVADSNAELQKKNGELENRLKVAELEIDRLRTGSTEAETVQLQLDTLSDHFRGLLESREAEIRTLQTKLQELMVTESGSPSQMFMSSNEDEELQTLRDQIQQLRAEVSHWKNVVQMADGQGDASQQLVQIHQQLVSITDRHQAEIASLQHAHIENIRALRTEYETKITALQQCEEKSTRSQLDTDDWNQGWQEDDKDSCKKTDILFDDFQEKYHQLEMESATLLREKEDLFCELEAERKANSEVSAQFDLLRIENEKATQQQFLEMQELGSSVQEAYDNLLVENQKLMSTYSDLKDDYEAKKSENESFASLNCDINSHIESLKSDLIEYEIRYSKCESEKIEQLERSKNNESQLKVEIDQLEQQLGRLPAPLEATELMEQLETELEQCKDRAQLAESSLSRYRLVLGEQGANVVEMEHKDSDSNDDSNGWDKVDHHRDRSSTPTDQAFQLVEKTAQCNQLHEQLTVKTAQLEQVQSDLKILHEQMTETETNLRTNVQRLTEETDKKEQELEAIRNELENSQSINTDLTMQLEMAENRLNSDDKNPGTKELEQHAARMKEQLQESRKNEEINARIREQLEDQVVRMRQQVEECTNRMEQAEEKAMSFDQLETVIESLTIEKSTLNDRLQANRQTELEARETAKNRVVELESSLGTAIDEKQQLVLLVQQKHDECVNYHQEAQKLAESTELAHRQRLNAEQSIERLQLELDDEKRRIGQTAGLVRQTEEERWKTDKELERLREHLLMLEDNYTKEAVAAEERETNLRMRLREFEQDKQRAFDLTLKMEASSDDKDEQLKILATQRDVVMGELEQTKTQLHETNISLASLQTVLKEIERENDDELQHELDNTVNEFRRAEEVNRQDRDELQLRLTKLTTIIDDQDEQLRTMELELQKKNIDSGIGYVDQEVLRNLLLSYFTAANDKKREVAHLIASVLSFSTEEISRMDGGSTGGGPFGFLSNSDQSNRLSITEQFIKFLESESTEKVTSASIPFATEKPRISLSGPESSLQDTLFPNDPLDVSGMDGSSRSSETLREMLQD